MKQLRFYIPTFFFLVLLVFLRIHFLPKPVVMPKGEAIVFQTTLKKEPKISGRWQVLSVGDGKVYLDLFPRYQIGDVLRIDGKVDASGRMFNVKAQKFGHKDNFAAIFASWRGQISSRIAGLLPSREAALVTGTVLGLDNIDRAFQDQLIKTGTIHVVVVSGENLAIVWGVLMGLVKYVGRRKAMIFSILVLVFYGAISGFGPSVMRAILMVGFASAAVFFGREANRILTIILAALVIVLVWPDSLSSISFQLTFAATLGIVLLGRGSMGSKDDKGSRRSMGKIAAVLGENAMVAIAAYLFTAPIILYYFGRVWILAPLVNILVVWVIPYVMILGFFVAGTVLVFMPLAQILAYFAYVPAFYFVKVVDLFSQISWGQVELGKGSIWMVVLWYGLLGGIIWVGKGRKSVVRG